MVVSKNAIEIRLPDERWTHIIEEHRELVDGRQDVLETIANPDRVVQGNLGELLAVREIEPGRWSVVIYRELMDDGFVITAF